MILILTDDSDLHADVVEEKLRRRGAEFLRFDPGRFPSTAELSLAYSATGDVLSMITVGGARLDLSQVKAVWYRRPTISIPHAEITDQLARDYVTDECKIVIQDLWNSLECFWLP